MSREYYERIGKTAVLAYPDKYPWNCVLAYIQFTCDELLSVRDYLDIVAVVKYQKAVTRAWLRKHFAADIDESHHIGWKHVEFYVKQ